MLLTGSARSDAGEWHRELLQTVPINLHLQCTPSALQQLLQHWVEENHATFTTVLIGGEALSCSEATRAMAATNGPVHNLYGPTEATVWSTVHECGAGEEWVPIGKPIANTQMYVLDEEMREVPVGVAGELYIGGAGLARGYLKRAGMTGERFVPNPYGGAGSRLYRTGDMGRWRRSGELEYLGRRDEQVKLRGYRIELGEVEAAIREYVGVGQAAAVVREDVGGDRRLVGYWVGVEGGREVDGGELRKYLQERLPEYMVPSALVRLEAMPMTANGKLDRRNLPAPDRSGVGSGYVAPRTEVEEQIAGIWAEVLGLERVGIRDNFFDLGGHSLLLLRLHAMLGAYFARTVPLVQLFRYPSVETLAVFLSTPNADVTNPNLSVRVDAGRERVRKQLVNRLANRRSV